MMDSLEKQLEKLSINMEKMKLAEYVGLLNRPRKLLYINFIAGIARGFGIAIGFTILGAIALLILQRLMVLKLPLVGDFIAELVKYVQESKGLRP